MKISRITARLQDFKEIIGITCIDRGLLDYNKDNSEDCTRLQGSVRLLGWWIDIRDLLFTFMGELDKLLGGEF